MNQIYRFEDVTITDYDTDLSTPKPHDGLKYDFESTSSYQSYNDEWMVGFVNGQQRNDDDISNYHGR